MKSTDNRKGKGVESLRRKRFDEEFSRRVMQARFEHAEDMRENQLIIQALIERENATASHEDVKH